MANKSKLNFVSHTCIPAYQILKFVVRHATEYTWILFRFYLRSTSILNPFSAYLSQLWNGKLIKSPPTIWQIKTLVLAAGWLKGICVNRGSFECNTWTFITTLLATAVTSALNAWLPFGWLWVQILIFAYRKEVYPVWKRFWQNEIICSVATKYRTPVEVTLKTTKPFEQRAELNYNLAHF